ncbi:MAG TPA: hypothetical protein VLE89_08775 [Chlamydiales bacterium]|nr:hypothetical protein [Chlamydiales bacterium]
MANRSQPLSRITTIWTPVDQGGEEDIDLENPPTPAPSPIWRTPARRSQRQARPGPLINQFWNIYDEATRVKDDETPIFQKEGFSKLFTFAVSHRANLRGKICFKATLQRGLSTAKCAAQFDLLKDVAFIHQTLNPGAEFPHIVQALGHFINGNYLPAFSILDQKDLDLNIKMAESIARLVQTYKLENPTTSNHLLNLLQFFSEQHSRSHLKRFHSTLRV